MTDENEVVEEPREQPDGIDEAAESTDDDALATAQAEAAENQERYLRLAAELDNVRRRAERDVERAHLYGIEGFARELLAVVDSLEMGLEAADGASAETLLEGTQATLKLLASALQKHHVEVVDPQGEPFDPELHEAMAMQPSDRAEPGSVLNVVQKGYQLNGRLLRPARVIVASEPAPSS